MNEIKQYAVRKILKTVHDVKTSHTFYRNEIERLDGMYQTLEQAKQAIQEDKKKYGDSYIYAVAEDKTGRNEIIHKE